MPAFVVLGPEALGLTLPPTDFHILKDGRLLLFSRTELAIGDGQHWEVVRKSPTDGDELGDVIGTRSVAVDSDGTIYAGIRGGFARVEFGEDGMWRYRRVAPYPTSATRVFPILTDVTMTDDGWFWHSGSGPVIQWKPGTEARVITYVNSVERIISARGRTYMTNASTSMLDQLGTASTDPILPLVESITAGAQLDQFQTLFGMGSSGLKVFDGSTIKPFVTRGLLAGGQRITDVCETEPGLFVAALDAMGLVFFDRTGRTIQVLDRRMDHRLARAQRVLYSAGTVWVLLHDGIARVQFPARVSNFEWFLPTALAYAKPFRQDGRLWLLASGRAFRGIYSDEQRLVDFDQDSPPGRYVHMLSSVTGDFLATNEQGIFLRENDAWRLIIPDIIDARIEVPSHDGKRWAYFARGEYGWLIREGDNFTVQRIKDDRFDHDFYLIHPDAHGNIWLEMGAGKFARARLGDDVPTLEIFEHKQGQADTWVNIFSYEGNARFNIAGHIYRLDETTQELVEDTELGARIPDIGIAIGRPATDLQGRLWVNARGTVKVLDVASGDVHNSVEYIPPRLQPNAFIVEADGVVWLTGARLSRFDPAIPVAPPNPLRAVISRATFTASNRTVFNPAATLPPVEFAENAIAVQFTTPGIGLGQAVVFDVMLEGAGARWTSTGAARSAIFNHLKEGSYTLRVRPRSGSQTGAEATLALVVRPPWFRTTGAYVGYAISTGLLIGGIAWLLSYSERRDRTRLERLVAQRTAELSETNRQLEQQVAETVHKASELQVSEERYRLLSTELEQRVARRTAELNKTNDRLIESNRELEAFSYSVSHDLRAPLRNISGFATLLRKRLTGQGDPEADRFLTIVSSESVRLGQLIDSLLIFSRLITTEVKRRPVELAPLIVGVRNELATETADRVIDWKLGELPVVQGDPTLLRQVLANLIANAVKFTRARDRAVIEVGALPDTDSGAEHVLFVRDNGAGFSPKHSDKLFGVFQRLHSAREYEGTGIGLATVRRIITRHGGRVWAEGIKDGGATIFFALPKVPFHPNGSNSS